MDEANADIRARASVEGVFEDGARLPWRVVAGGRDGRDPNAYDVVDGRGHKVCVGFWGGKCQMEAIVAAVNAEALRRYPA